MGDGELGFVSVGIGRLMVGGLAVELALETAVAC